MWNNHISASIICIDPLNLNRNITSLVSQGVYKYHADFMDNNFVPRLGIYPEIIKRLKQDWNVEIDSHLMIKNPERCIDEIAPYSDWITLPYEVCEDPIRLVQFIKKDYDCKVALAFNILTPIPDWFWSIKDIDGILLMGISPGVLNSNHYEEIVWNKLLHYRKDLNYNKDIFIDGAVNFKTIKKYFEHSIIGENTTVICGSNSLFKDVDLINNNVRINEQIIYKNISELEKCILL